jgi:hypothetical protein
LQELKSVDGLMPAIMHRHGFDWVRASVDRLGVCGDWLNQLSVLPGFPLYMAPIGGAIRGPLHKGLSDERDTTDKSCAVPAAPGLR